MGEEARREPPEIPGSKADKKHVSAHFRYKNLISIDWRYKLVRRYAASSAAMHDSHKLDKPALAKLGCRAPTTPPAGCGPTAYRIKLIGAKLAERDLKRYIHRRSSRNKPRTAREEPANKTRSKIRAQVGQTAGLIARRTFAAVRFGDQRALLARAMAALNSHASSIPRRDVIGLVDFASPSRARTSSLSISAMAGC